MYKWFIALLVIGGCSVSSCGRYATHKYQIGKSFRFENKKAFTKYIVKQTGFDAESIYYANQNGYYSLMSEIQHVKREGILWGFYAGKQSYLKMDSSELENLYCKHRIQNLASAFFMNGILPEPYLTDSAVIQSFNLKRLSDNHSLAWSDFANKRVLVLQFATAYGSYYKDLFSNISLLDANTTKSGKAIILCLDPIYQLP